MAWALCNINVFTIFYIPLTYLLYSMHRIIENFDQNKDGKVSKEELLAGVEQHFKSKKIDDLPGFIK